MKVTEEKEVRKIQFTGRSTYILSLPKRWIKEMHLNAGDQVTLLRESNNSLAIVPEAGVRAELIDEATALLSTKESASTLGRKVVAMYLAGFNVIHLRLRTGRIEAYQRDAVREIVRKNLVGTEVIADGSDVITLQVLLSFPELSVSTAIRRMYLIATSMHKDAMAALQERSGELAKSVITSDDEVDRFSLYIHRNLVIASQNGRILREIGLKKPSDCLSYRAAVKSIERIADHASSIAERSLKLKEKMQSELTEKICKMSTVALAAVSDSVESLLRRDYELADKTVSSVDHIYDLESEALAALNKTRSEMDSGAIKFVIEDIRRTAEYASDIAEAAINETIDEVIETRSSRQNDKQQYH